MVTDMDTGMVTATVFINKIIKKERENFWKTAVILLSLC